MSETEVKTETAKPTKIQKAIDFIVKGAIAGVFGTVFFAGFIRVNAQYAFGSIGMATSQDVTELWSENTRLREVIKKDSVEFADYKKKTDSINDSLRARISSSEKNIETTAAILYYNDEAIPAVDKSSMAAELNWNHPLATESILHKVYVNADIARMHIPQVKVKK